MYNTVRVTKCHCIVHLKIVNMASAVLDIYHNKKIKWATEYGR